MTQTGTVGFIGFGEAAFHISRGLIGAGIGTIAAFDLHAGAPGRGDLISKRAAEAAVDLVTRERLAEVSDILLSAVTADQTLAAATAMAPYLTPRHVYADLNSVSPGVKQAVDAVVRGQGARFVEAAVMSPVPPHGHRVPMLLGGNGAADFRARLSPFGMNLEVLSEAVGQAVAVKMCRSIVVKGLESLMVECAMAATRFGAHERVFSSLSESFPGLDWNRLAHYMTSRVAAHAERRAREMEEVCETLKGIGIEPVMAAAAVRRLDWCARLKLNERFGGKPPEDYVAIMKAIEEHPDA